MTTEERLEKLEKDLTRANRRSRVLLVVTAVLLIAVTMLYVRSGAVHGSVRAEAFRLVGKDGKVRAALTLSDSGQPGLALRDKDGRGSILLDVPKYGQPRLILGVGGKYRAILAVGDSGQPRLWLYDTDGNGRAALALSGTGKPQLELNDQSNRPRVILGATQLISNLGLTTNYTESSLLLFGPAGGLIWQAPSSWEVPYR